MRIGVDARMLGKGFGLARYTEQLLEQLDTLEHDHHIVVFLLESARQHFKPKHTERFTVISTDIPWYSLREQYAFPRVIEQAGVNLMHFTHFNVPLAYRGRFVVTIHDLTMYHFPRPEATTHGALVYWLKDQAHRWVVSSAAKRAAHIITTSEYVKRDVHQTLQVPLEKMTTVYQAPFDQGRIDKRKKAITSEPYILYVGAAYPHKNITGLLDAWERYDGEGELVLVGKENYFWKKLQPRIDALEHVRYLGFQTDEELGALYAHARAFVFPSLSEGFGIPPLEAMQRTVPVLSSNASCLPEVLGDAALYTDATNPDMFAASIETIMQNNDVRHELLMNSKSVLRQYSPERFGKETLELYNKIV